MLQVETQLWKENDWITFMANIIESQNIQGVILQLAFRKASAAVFNWQWVCFSITSQEYQSLRGWDNGYYTW